MTEPETEVELTKDELLNSPIKPEEIATVTSLFDKDPRSMADQELDQVVERVRAACIAWSKEQTTAAREGRKPKLITDLKLEDLTINLDLSDI